MNISEFQNQVSKNGLARGNRFLLEISPPQGLSAVGSSLLAQRQGGGAAYPVFNPNIGLEDIIDVGLNISTGFGDIQIGIGGALQKLELFCKSCQIPSRDLLNFDFEYYGEKRQGVNGHAHEGINCSFYSSEDLRERKFFENWQNLIFDPATKKNSYYDNYVGEVVVKKMDTNWKYATAIYKLKEAYPTNVGSMELSMENGDFVETTMTWNYRYYERVL